MLEIFFEMFVRVLSDQNLRIVDRDSLDSLRFMVTGGLKNGVLLVGGKPSYVFGYSDLKQNKVAYQHDDSDTMDDQIELRITDGGPPGPVTMPDAGFTIPVLVMPKDDSPPEITSNLMIKGNVQCFN